MLIPHTIRTSKFLITQQAGRILVEGWALLQLLNRCLNLAKFLVNDLDLSVDVPFIWHGLIDCLA